MNDQFTFSSSLDGEFLETIYEGDMEHVQVVFEQFVDMAPVQMHEIDELFNAGEVELFRQKIHKIKPVFSFVGLTTLTGEAEVIEKRCREISSINELKENYNLFKHNYTSSFETVKNELDRIKNLN